MTESAVGSSWRLRPYTDLDRSAVDDMLDADSDALWVAQGHRLHGAAGDGDRWRRTVVVEMAGRVAGAVTVARNRVHPGRYNLAVEVASASRRRGLGRALVEEAQRLTSTPVLLAAKVRPSDAAGLALLRNVGGRIYQRCSGLCPDPTSPEVLTWAAHASPDSGTEVLPLSWLPRAEWAELWVRQYVWVHEDWSPVAEQPLRELAPGLVADADPELSTITVRDGSVTTVTWVFAGENSSVEVVAETTHRDTPNGVAQLAAGMARTLSKSNERGLRRAEIDGHVSDPHLGPVLDAFPIVPANPLYLVEVPRYALHDPGN